VTPAGGVLLVLGDFADERCGVGSSEAALVGLVPGDVTVVDPVRGSTWRFRRDVRAARRSVRGAVVAYPTISQVERVRLVPRLLLLRLAMRDGRWLRVHLHEFDQLRRRHRIGAALLVGAIADRVVVSSEREALALRTHYRGWAGRSEIAVVPPANGSAPAGAASEPSPGRRGTTVGLLGQNRPDKGEPWLLEVLERLDRRFDRLEIVGRDWQPDAWPEAVRERYEIVVHGEAPASELPALLGSWDLAIAPFEVPAHDGRCSLRTMLAFGVPTLTRGPRPDDLRLDAPHLLFDDEIDLAAVPDLGPAERQAGAAAVAALESAWREQLVEELYGP
jgi:hypothetical protein